MAGRGRDMTKPAWMTSGSVPGASAAAVTAVSSGAAGEPSGRSESRDVERNGHDEGRERRSRSRDRHRDGSRDRDRQRRHDRDDRRSRSRSPGRGRDDRDRRRRSESRSRSRSRDRDERSSRRRDDDRYVREGSSSRSGLGGGAHSGAGAGSLGSSVAGSVVQAMQSAGFMPQSAGAGFGVPGAGMGGGGAPLIDTKALIAAAMANATTSSSTLAATKTARRLYIGNIGPTTEAELTAFFNAVLARAYQPGDHILSVYINHEKHFAFLEFRTVELTTACLQLDGVYFKGQQLRMRRPNDYNAAIPATGPPITLRVAELGLVSQTVPDGPNKVFIGGLPYHLGEADVRSLLEALGPLKAFHLVKDAGSVTSKGYAFCEWSDPALTEVAINGLHGTPLGEKTLTVRRAMPQGTGKVGPPGPLPGGGMGMPAFGALPPSYAPPPGYSVGLESGAGLQTAAPTAASWMGAPPAAAAYAAPPPPLPAAPAAPLPPAGGAGGGSFISGEPSTLLRLTNMVTAAEVAEDGEYRELCDEIGEELRRYGRLVQLTIPREGPAVGNVFAAFADVNEALAAARAVAGRVFAGRTIAVHFERG